MSNDGSDADGPAGDESGPDDAGDAGRDDESVAGPGAGRPVVRWFHRPIALGAVALVLAVSGASTIAYAVTRPDANHPPSVVGARDVSGGVPVPVLPAAPVATPTSAGTPTSSVAPTPSVPPPLPAATVVPLLPAATPSATSRRSPGARASGSASPSPTRTPSTSPKPSPTPTPVPSRTTATKTLPAPLGSSDPVEVVVRKLGIDRKPIRLGLTKDNALEVPDDAEDLGWYTGGPTPGAMGAAVIAGHVSYNKPGVFYRLATLQRGDTIQVKRKDGTTAVFTVSGTRVYPKDKFPTDDVYGFVDRAALRLITCGGDYDAKTRHFDDNIVVYADMTSVTR